MATLATFPKMLERDRERCGFTVGQVAWRLGVSVREYREIEAGDREPSPGTYETISELHGWPQTFAGQVKSG